MRPRAKALLERAGDRLARLDALPGAHRVLLRAIAVVIPRRFDAAAAQDLDAVFELRVRHPRGRSASRFTLLVTGGRCELRRGAVAGAGAVATLGADDMIRLASGAAGWPQLLTSGRLELSGDPFLALRFPALFRLPVRLSAVPSQAGEPLPLSDPV